MSLVAISLFVVLFLLQNTLGAIVSLITFIAGLIPWLYDRLEEYEKTKAKLRTIKTLLSEFEDAIERRFPAFVVGKSIDDGESTLSLFRRLDEIPSSDSLFLEEVADQAIQNRCRDAIVDEFGIEVFHHLVLHITSEKLNRRRKRLTKSILRAFLGENIVFLDTGPVYSPEGETFVKSVVYLRSRGGVFDLEDFRRYLRSDMDAIERNKVSLELSDPQLSFMVYELGKGSDLLDLVRRKMSGRRLIKGLSAMTPKRKPSRESFNTFLILKQEKRGGDRYLKERINAVSNRIVAPGWLYTRGKATRNQSVSILRVSSRFSTAEDFVRKHFSEIPSLNMEELKRAGLVAIPLIVNDAYFYPEDPTTLRPAQKDFYQKWTAFFKRDRKTFQELLTDFDVTFLDLADMLSLDFLVKDISQREKEYLREETEAILSRLGLKSLLEISNLTVSQLKKAMSSQGYPNYEVRDIAPFIDSYVIPLRQFLDNRLSEISRYAIRNSKKLLKLSKPR